MSEVDKSSSGKEQGPGSHARPLREPKESAWGWTTFLRLDAPRKGIPIMGQNYENGNGNDCPASGAPRLLMTHRDDPDRACAIRLPCRRWTCPACQKSMMAKRLAHYAGVLSDCEGRLFVGLVKSDREWLKIHNRITREGAQWLWLRTSSGRLLIATADVLDVGIWLTPAQAGELLRVAAGKVDPAAVRKHGERLWSSCRDWAPRRLPGSSGRWRPVGRLATTADVDGVVAALEQAGIHPKSRSMAVGWIVSWKWPADWVQVERSAIVGQFGLGKK